MNVPISSTPDYLNDNGEGMGLVIRESMVLYPEEAKFFRDISDIESMVIFFSSLIQKSA